MLLHRIEEHMAAQDFNFSSKTPDELGHLLLAEVAKDPGKMDEEKALALIAAGANIEVSAEKHDERPLHHAAYKGHAKVVTALLAAQAETNATDWLGFTPAMNAVLGGHAEIFDTLVQRTDNLNRKNEFGETMLYIAAEQGYAEIARRLIALGVDLNAAADNKLTPQQIAAQKGHPDVEKMINDAINAPIIAAAERKRQIQLHIGDTFREGLTYDASAPKRAAFRPRANP